MLPLSLAEWFYDRVWSLQFDGMKGVQVYKERFLIQQWEGEVQLTSDSLQKYCSTNESSFKTCESSLSPKCTRGMLKCGNRHGLVSSKVIKSHKWSYYLLYVFFPHWCVSLTICPASSVNQNFAVFGSAGSYWKFLPHSINWKETTPSLSTPHLSL